MSDELELKDVQHAELEVESTEIDISEMPPKEKKRYRARLRKRRQREHEKKGILSGIENRLCAEWKLNLQQAEEDPAVGEPLRERLSDFVHLRSEMQTAMARLWRGVHPEALPEMGRFPDVIGQNLLAHIHQYGDPIRYEPMEFIFMKHSSEPHRVNAVEALRFDPRWTYRIKYGLNIDRLWSLEVEDYFQTFAEFFLRHRDDPDLDFDWQISDELLLGENGFQIPEKYLHGVFGRSTKSVWVRLDRRRRGLLEENHR